MKLGLISNPYAKVCKLEPLYNSRLWYALGNSGIMNITKTIPELERVCQEYYERKIDTVGIVGGDGSIGLVLTHLSAAYKENPPKIIILPGGTINFLRNNFNLKGDPLKILKNFLASPSSFKEKKIGTLEVNGRLGFLFAAGIASDFLTLFYKQKKSPLSAFLFFINHIYYAFFNKKKSLLSAGPLSFSSEPHAPEKSYNLVFASTVPKVFFNLFIFKKLPVLKNKCFEVLAFNVKQNSILSILIDLLRTDKRKGYQQLTDSLSLSINPQTTVSLDGDIIFCSNSPISLRKGPQVTFLSQEK